MIPVIAIVGRPNVGKSTLFNRLTRSRDALVADFAGLTRDRKYGEGRVGDIPFIVVDTGGLSGEEYGIDSAMANQSLQAIEEADAVLFLVDARSGLTAADSMVAAYLRKNNKKTWLVVNKVDGSDINVVTAEFHELGIELLRGISSAHNRGINSLMEDVLAEFSSVLPEKIDDDKSGIRIAVIGRPNVGKSTLVNRMLGEDRVVVYDKPGTTRDSVYIPYERHGQLYTLIDTAGVRRRKNVNETVEKFSIIKALQAIKDSNVVIAVFDAQEGVVDQDLHMLSFALDSGRALVIAVNKWDGMDPHERKRVKVELERRLTFVSYAKIHFISALHGTCVGDLYPSINKAYVSATTRWPTHRLTQILEKAILDNSLPLAHGRRIKLRYAHLGGANPPRIIIHGNQADKVPNNYRRYLENTYRSALKIEGTPIAIEFKTGDNPYSGRRNKLTDRQVEKRKRLMKHAKRR